MPVDQLERKARQAEAKKAWKMRNPDADKKYYAANAEKIKARERARNAANPEVNRARAAAWKLANKERVRLRDAAAHKADASARCAKAKQWCIDNPEAKKANDKAWREANPLKVKINKAVRRSRVRQATPGWACIADIKDVYLEAQHMQLNVDHIIPLKHPLVCGLHVWNNLQLLTRSENASKGNKFAVGEHYAR